jgi:3-hydroxyisobutyrate dehydrogenase-like beta-hydroxyacid dehydrogenase
MTPMRVAVLGLGEAGSRIAADLEAAGAAVAGYDPDPVRGAGAAADLESAVAGSDVVVSVNSAAVAAGVAAAASPALGPDAIYADLNTAPPGLKRQLAALVPAERFADVALLGPVPARGLQTPSLASGGGAEPFARAFGALGMPVEVVEGEPGAAAELKLLRSVFMKGLAAAAVESHTAAVAAGHEEWVDEQIAGVIGRPLLERLLEGSATHAARRVEEMEAAKALLLELGVEPRIADASARLLADLDQGRS